MLENVTDHKKKQIIAEAKNFEKSLAFAYVLKYITDSLWDEWKSTGPDDIEKREAIYNRVVALDDVRATLRAIASETVDKENSNAS